MRHLEIDPSLMYTPALLPMLDVLDEAVLDVTRTKPPDGASTHSLLHQIDKPAVDDR